MFRLSSSGRSKHILPFQPVSCRNSSLRHLAADENCAVKARRTNRARLECLLSLGEPIARRLFAVTYGWFGFYGKDGSQTIIESHVWERDRSVHLASGIVPSMFNGFLTNSAEVCWFADADQHWVLV